MDNKSFRIPVVLSVFVALVMVFAACAPAITPGSAPREIPIGPEVVEEAPVLTPEVELSDEQRAIAEATTLEDFLSRLDSISVPPTEEELDALAAAVELQQEEHMVTEFPTATLFSLDEELAGLATPVETQIEEHMVTEFTTGIVTLDDEFISAYGLAPVEQIEEDIELEFVPEEGPIGVLVGPGVTVVDELTDSYLVDEFAVEGFQEDFEAPGVTIVDEDLEIFADEFAPTEDLLVPSLEEAAPIMPSIQLGSADFMNGDLVVKTQISGFSLDPEAIGKPKVEGSGHWHLYIDGKLAGLSATDNLIIGKDKLAEFGSGLHDVKVELHNNDHSLVSDTAWTGAKIEFGASMMAPEIEKESKMGGYSY